MHEILEMILETAVEYGSVLLEMAGVGIMIYYGATAFWKLVRKDKMTPLYLGKGISHALEFLMCGEVLKTVTAHEYSDFISLAVSVAVRAALSVLIHWETMNEKKELEEEEEIQKLKKEIIDEVIDELE